MGECVIVAAEMMAAARPDDLRTIAPEFRTYSVVLILAVKALDHPRIDRSEGGFGRYGILAGRLSEPTGDADLKIGRRSKPEQRDLDHPLLGLPSQPVKGEWQDPGAKRVPDQGNLRCSPAGRVGIDHQTEIVGDLLWRLTAPEVVQAVPTDYRHAV